MVVSTLLSAGAVQAATGVSFLLVGTSLHQRKPTGAGLLAARCFVAWWWAMGTYMLLEGIALSLAAAGTAPFELLLALRLVAGPLIAAAAASLAFYIIFLFSGTRAWFAPLVVYYGLAAIAYDYSVLAHDPNGVVVASWHAGLSYAEPLAGDPLWTAVLASFGLPLIAGSIAYLTLLRRATSREQRYRIILVGASLLMWVSSGFAGQLGSSDFLRFFTLVVVGLATAGAVLAAYYPPRPVRAWLYRGAEWQKVH